MSSPSSRYTSLVDWDANGNYTGTYDDITHYVLPADTITVSGQGRDQARGTAPPQQPRMEQTLLNLDRLFSSEFASSPLAGNLLPGRPTQFRITIGNDWLMDSPDVPMDSPEHFMEGAGFAYALFTGVIDSIDEDPILGRNRVRLTSHGRLSRLERARVETQLYASITTGAAMQYLLAAAGLSASEYSIDSDVVTNGRILAYWYGDGSDAYSQALALWATEGYSAFFGEDEDGIILFQGRNYRTLSERSQEVQATFRDVLSGDDLWHVGFRLHPGIRDVINRPVVEIVQRQAAALAVVWEYGSNVLTLDGTGAASVRAAPSDPFVGAVAPSVASGDFVVSAGTVSVALSRASGASTEIQFSGGSPGATISTLRLRAQVMAVTGGVTAETLIDTSASIATYGERSLQLDALPGLALTDAVSLCDAMAIAYQEPRPVVELDTVNDERRVAVQIMRLLIGDRIHVVDSWSGADLDVLIEQRRHRITNGPSHLVTFGCEKVVEADWGLYDDGLYGVALFGQ
jgi:hypothetical protein